MSEIIKQPIEEEVKSAYLDYAMSVIVGRAIPDVRDGLKPVQRRILYAMNELGLYPNKPYKKSARIVGECFVAGTLVNTEKGLKPIEKIERGEKVYTQKGLREVTELYIMPPQPLLEVELETGVVNRITKGQMFKVFDETLTFVWKRADELKEGDYIVLSAKEPDISEYQIVNGLKIDEDIAYLLGLFLADGWIDKDKRGYKRIAFGLDDKSVLDRINEILLKKFAKKENIQHRESHYILKINGKNINDQLIQALNIENKKSENIYIPKFIFQSPKSVVFSFLSGFIDGDGSIHLNRNVLNVTSISEKFIRELQILLFQYGIISKLFVSQPKENKIGNKTIKGKNKVYSLEISGHFLKKLAEALTLSHSVKRNRLSQIKNFKQSKFDEIPFIASNIFKEFSEKHLGGGWYLSKEGKKVRVGIKYPDGTKIRYSKDLSEKIKLYKNSIFALGIYKKLEIIGSRYKDFIDTVIKDNLFFVKVKSIREIEPEITYDIQVAEEHEFIANGMLSHNCLGKYHPHGDTSVYDALVRMAQDFTLRYPLIQGQGNFGSIDGDPPAAMRYTEARLTKLAMEMLADIDKNTVDMKENFDASLMEPEVLPAKFPNLICNGAAGIAVGLSTNIPPHNFTEVAEALKYLAEFPNATVEELCQFIKGPDFPTGGVLITPKEEIIKIYQDGRGSVTVKGKARIEKLPGNRHRIIIYEIPYQVNKVEFIKRIAELVRKGQEKGISDLRDESDRDGIRIIVELKREADPEKVLKKLYRRTQLQKSIPINFTVLVGKQPKTLDLKGILWEFIKHRIEVIIRRTLYELEKAEKRLHIVEGLLKALENADRVIEIVRGSKDVSSAKEQLKAEFGLSDAQSQAILDMRLSRFTALEGDKLYQEADELRLKIEEYQRILSSEEEKIKVFIQEMDELLEKFGDERKTMVMEEKGEQLTFDEDFILAVLSSGRIINRKFDETETKEEVYQKVLSEVITSVAPGEKLISIQEVKSSTPIAFITNKGRAYWSLVADLPKGEGKINIEEGEIVGTSFKGEGDEDRLFILTKKGIIKRMSYEDIFYKSQNHLIIPLTEDDEVVQAFSDDHPSAIAVYTRKGDLLMFDRSQVRVTGDKAKGVEAIDLDEGDEVRGGFLINSEEYVLTITEKGYTKLVRKEEFYTKEGKLKKRAQKGLMAVKLSKDDALSVATSVNIGDNLLLSTEKGRILKLKIDENTIPVAKRTAMGEQLIKIEGDKVVRAIKPKLKEEAQEE